jgi:hypothetical protein
MRAYMKLQLHYIFDNYVRAYQRLPQATAVRPYQGFYITVYSFPEMSITFSIIFWRSGSSH